ncbi:MAG: hypothetical protein ACOYOD_01700 [Saprospiraceae bacterium]
MPVPVRLIGAFATVAICAFLLFLRFGDYLRFEKGMVIEPYGDGLKAYMSPAYHALYDSTWTLFQGMHYPYGDHLVMSDPMPIVANGLKLFHSPGSDLIDETIRWTHLSMLLSILVSALFLYLILERLQLPVWLACTAALALSFMAPMVARMGFHFGLAQPAALPMAFYFLMRFQESPRWGYSALLAFTILFFSLFHFHYFGLFVLGISLYYFIDFMLIRRGRHWARMLPHYALQVLVPFVLLNTWLGSGPEVSDRASQPWGFSFYRARLEGLFTSAEQRQWQWVDRWVSPLPDLDIEAQNYIGLFAGFGLFLLLAIQLRAGFRRPLLPDAVPQRAFLVRLLPASLLLLLFALGLPFALPGVEPLLRFTGPLQQFRALGRFSWMFYFAANLFVLAWASHLLRREKWALGAIAALLCVESYQYIMARNLALDPIPSLQANASLAQQALIDPGDYQAITTVPFFHLGSESFWWEPTHLQQEAMVLALRTGLPLCNAMLSRTSRSQTIKQLQLMSEPYRPPVLLKDLPDQRPLLLLYDKRGAAAQSPKWDHFRSALDTMGIELLFTTNDFNLYKLPLSFFEKNLGKREQEMATLTDTLAEPDPLRFVRRSFDELKSGKKYQGAGALQSSAHKVKTLYDGPVPLAGPEGRYAMSFWAFVDEDLRSRSEVHVRVYHPQTGETAFEIREGVHRWSTVFDPKGWALVEYELQAAAGMYLHVSVQNKMLGRAPLYFDEWLLRPANYAVKSSGGHFFSYNNRFYKK